MAITQLRLFKVGTCLATVFSFLKRLICRSEPLNFGIPDGSTGFSSRLAATQDMPFIHQSPELGDLDTWQENTNAWEEEDAAWQAKEVLRQQKTADREERAAEQQRKKMENEAQQLMKKEQNKIGVKVS
ncbi:hypothetical protein FD755_011823 [Muntiacus reevesi]|uniref:Receptor-binding cancer antigen expressed on SiSo cells n=1 Tax=Muntiacus reevesi TaxID=9886 RepID=A0A5N3XU52_MUNRE|nr:hypothetical protein FD755_011823 [Muntiacus reevesi]